MKTEIVLHLSSMGFQKNNLLCRLICHFIEKQNWCIPKLKRLKTSSRFIHKNSRFAEES